MDGTLMGFWFWVAIAIPVILAVVGAAIGVHFDNETAWLGLLFGGFVGGLTGVLFAIAPMTYAHAHYNERELTCKVLDKDRTEDDMRVYTSCGTFENADSMWRGKYESSDTWAKLQPGEVQTLTVYGWRQPFLSEFPNILEVKDSNWTGQNGVPAT